MTENQEPLPEVIWHAKDGGQGVVECWSKKGEEAPVPLVVEARSCE